MYSRFYTHGKPEEFQWTYDPENEWWTFHRAGYAVGGCNAKGQSGLTRSFFDEPFFRSQHENEILGKAYARICIEYPDGYFDDGPDCD